MEENKKLLESLLERAADFGKTSYELAKLKALDKTTDIASSVIPHAVVIVLITSFMLFFNLGLAFWMGEILGKIFYGFFAVAVFYIVMGIIIHYFLHEWLKKLFCNYFIKLLLN